MTKNLKHTIDLNQWVVKYYLTIQTKSDFSYYGVMVTSESEDKCFCEHISDIFPYEHNALEFLMYLHKHSVTPLTIREITLNYIESKIFGDA